MDNQRPGSEPALREVSIQIRALFIDLHCRHGLAADPEHWWPATRRAATPRGFERAAGAVLRQNAWWADVRPDLDRLALAGLLDAPWLAAAFRSHATKCARAFGDARTKADAHVGLAALIAAHGTEGRFCSGATRERMVALKGIGELTTDRILLFACGQPAWPTDDAGLRTFARRGLVRFPGTAEERSRVAAALRRQVVHELAGDVRALQALYAGLALDAAQAGVAGEPASPRPAAA